MFHVIVVEDEMRIREGIVKYVEWEKLGLEVIGAYEDGEKAYEAMKKSGKTIDILLTDILMPKVDGLQLISKVREMNKHVHIIVISGYEDFSYAQIAIKNGVDDYLLKPIKLDELQDTLSIVVDKLKTKKTSKALMNKYQIKNVLCDFLLEENKKEYLFFEQNEELKLLYKSWFVVVNISLKVKNENEKNEKELEKKLSKVLNQYLDDTYSQEIVQLLKHEKIIITYDINKIKLEILISVLNTIFVEDEFAVSISDIVKGIKNLPEAYRQCQVMKSKEFMMQSNVPMKYKSESNNILIEKFDCNDLIMAIKTQNKTKYQHELNEIQNFLMRMPSKIEVDMAFNYMLVNVVDNFVHLLKEENFVTELNGQIEKASMANNVYRVFEIFRYICDRILELHSQAEGDKYEYLIRSVIKYINENFTDPEISQDFMVKYSCMSNTYFNTYMKKETGKKFVEYLTDLRMNYALDLLKNKKLKVYEIAYQCGYSNETYFNTDRKSVV